MSDVRGLLRLWRGALRIENIEAMMEAVLRDFEYPAEPVNPRPYEKRFVVGADVFARQSDGMSIADQYERLRIRLKPANMDRVNGWAAILSRLGDPGNGITPRLFIHERCGRLLETLPAPQHDPARPEDVLKVDADENGVGGDNAADPLRYLVGTIRPHRPLSPLNLKPVTGSP